MTWSRAYLAYCFGVGAALLAACATDGVAKDTSSDDSKPPGQGDPSDSGVSSNPYGWDAAPGADVGAPQRHDSGTASDSGWEFEAGIDGGSCGADFLSDPANCGFCGHDCAGGACQSGHCMPVSLAVDQPVPYGIAVFGNTVVWANQGSFGSAGGVWAATTNSTPPAITLVATQNGAYLVAADAQNAYWTNQATGSVYRAPLAGGVTPIAIASGEDQPSGIAVTATHVYWTTYKGGFVRRTAVPGGGAIETLASGQKGPAGIAVDAQNVYFANKDGGSIASVPLAGGMVTTLADKLTSPLAVAVDAQKVYWTGLDDGSVSACPLGPDGGVEVVVPPAMGPPAGHSMGIVVEGQRLFYTRNFDTTTNANNGVFATGLSAGGSPNAVTQPPGTYPAAIAQDGKNLYFTNWTNGGAVMKVAK